MKAALTATALTRPLPAFGRQQSAPDTRRSLRDVFRTGRTASQGTAVAQRGFVLPKAPRADRGDLIALSLGSFCREKLWACECQLLAFSCSHNGRLLRADLRPAPPLELAGVENIDGDVRADVLPATQHRLPDLPRVCRALQVSSDRLALLAARVTGADECRRQYPLRPSGPVQRRCRRHGDNAGTQRPPSSPLCPARPP